MGREREETAVSPTRLCFCSVQLCSFFQMNCLPAKKEMEKSISSHCKTCENVDTIESLGSEYKGRNMKKDISNFRKTNKQSLAACLFLSEPYSLIPFSLSLFHSRYTARVLHVRGRAPSPWLRCLSLPFVDTTIVPFKKSMPSSTVKVNTAVGRTKKQKKQKKHRNKRK